MTLKEELILELEQTPDAVLAVVLETIRRLNQAAAEDQADIEAALIALAEVEREGTVLWDEVKIQVGLR